MLQVKSFDDNLQIGLSLAADLALFAYGSCFTMSSVVLPQIEDASNTSDLTITSEEGSWFGNDLFVHNYNNATYLYNVLYVESYQYAFVSYSEYFCNRINFWSVGRRNNGRKTRTEICTND